MKKFLLVLVGPLFASLMVSTVTAAAALPDGFQGLPWGSAVAALPNAKIITENPHYQCYRTGDGSASVAEAAVSNVRWCFSGDRFYFAQMEFNGLQAQEKLLAYAKAAWGEPKLGQRFTESFVWGGPADGVYVELEFSKIDNHGTLAFVYLPVYSETQEAAKRERVKPRMGSGF